MKSDIQCKSLHGMFKIMKEWVDMNNVRLHPLDMLEAFKHLPKALGKLTLNNVTLLGCKASLCEAVKRLISLRILYLCSLSLPGYEKKLCESFGGITQLKQLRLDDTDMVAAGKDLIACKPALQVLTFLKLADIHLTEEQTRGVVELLPSWPGLVYLSLAGLLAATAVEKLNQELAKLSRLRWLDVGGGGLDT